MMSEGLTNSQKQMTSVNVLSEEENFLTMIITINVQQMSVNILSEEESVCVQHVKLSLSIRYTYTRLSFPQARSA